MEIETQEVLTLNEPGTIANSNEDRSVVQEQLSLESLIGTTTKLEAEVLEKDASLEHLRREMADMENTMEVDKQVYLDQRKAESDAIAQRLALEEGRFRKENVGLKLKLQLRETEKESLQARCQQLESELTYVSQGFDEQSRQENMSLIEQRIELEIEFEKEKKPLQKLANQQKAEISKLKQKLEIEANLRKKEKQSFKSSWNKRESETAALSQRFTEYKRKLREENSELKLKAERAEAETRTTIAVAAAIRAEEKSLEMEKNLQSVELEKKLEAEKQSLQRQLDQQKTDSAVLRDRFAEDEQRLRQKNLELQEKLRQAELYLGWSASVPHAGFNVPSGQQQVVQNSIQPQEQTFLPVRRHQNYVPRYSPYMDRWNTPQQDFNFSNTSSPQQRDYFANSLPEDAFSDEESECNEDSNDGSQSTEYSEEQCSEEQDTDEDYYY